MDRDTMRPLAEILSAMALEMAEMERLSGRLQVVVADLVAFGGALGPHASVECQAADVLTQRLAGMVGFLSRLALVAGDDASIDIATALDELTLADQAMRLSGQGHAPPTADAGELELFDG